LPDGSPSGNADQDNNMGEDMPMGGVNVEGNVTEALDNFNGESYLPSDEDIVLPAHKQCVNHSLNLVARVDALKAQEDRLYQLAMEFSQQKSKSKQCCCRDSWLHIYATSLH